MIRKALLIAVLVALPLLLLLAIFSGQAQAHTLFYIGTYNRDVLESFDRDHTHYEAYFPRKGHDGILGHRGQDYVAPSYGWDEAIGGRGDDLLHGGPGSDVLDGGPGKDYLEDKNGQPAVDTLFCGRGDDKYVADEWDFVAADCEEELEEPPFPPRWVRMLLDAG